MTINFTPQEAENLFHTSMCNVFGMNHHEGYGLELKYKQKDYESAKKKLTDPCWEDVLLQILKDGGKLTLVDLECGGEYTKSITLEDVYQRIGKTPINHLVDAINEGGDVWTSDTIIQTVFYEEVIFG